MAATLEANTLTIVKRQLHVPPLEELASVLKEGLAGNFAEADVEIADCPDLTAEPFTLAAPGITGKATILEIGGPAYLLPSVQRNKLYDVRSLLRRVRFSEEYFAIGAGAGPWPHLNCNCELMMNLASRPALPLNNGSRISSVDKVTGECKLEILPAEETRFALLANLFVSEGKPGKVLKVRARCRTGPQDFIASMQKAIAAHYKDQLVGLGGTFLMRNGKAKQHVMPDFSERPLKSERELNDWLQFYEMSTPLIAVGTFVSSEADLDLRVQHFHSFSGHGEGGHYHIDTTPDTIEYLGYFTAGQTLYRVDQPAAGVQFGKD